MKNTMKRKTKKKMKDNGLIFSSFYFCDTLKKNMNYIKIMLER